MTTSGFQETVVLETLDGYEFEKLCAKIFQKLEYGTVEIMPLSGDAGRDLLVHTHEGLIVVECKHQPHTSVGRPVVQKLHSAVISSNAVRGILVTSGRFSVQATEHANTLLPKIDMIDKNILADLATRAGIELILEGKCHTVLRYPISNTNSIRNKISSFLERKTKSNPGKITELLTISERKIGLIPSYMIQYDINATFETNVGVIHREYLEAGKFLIDGNSGSLLKQEMANHLSSAPLAVYNEADFSGIPFTRSDFVIDDRSLANIAKKIIIDRHTKPISYTGRNNQHYTKLCVPAEKDVFISNIKQVYLPVQEVQFAIINERYGMGGIENAEKMLCYTTMTNCKVCNKYIVDNGLVCNSCGGLVHGPRFLDPHGFICKSCGKTICRNCAYKIGIMNKVCKDCAEKSGKSLLPVSKNMNQRSIAGGGCLTFSLLSFFMKINLLISIFLLIIGLVIFLTDYRATAPPYEMI
jgi:restriction system protein